jgi:endonuclease/exonuclease/phosphatase (EEP) superfamily protein YafD
LWIATILGFGGAWDWRLDLFNHARPICFFMSAVLFFLSLLFKNKLLSSLNFAFLLLNFSFVSFLYFPLPKNKDILQRGKSFSLFQYNVCAPSHNRTELIKYFNTNHPDIVSLEECDQLCFTSLKKGGIISRYPFIVHQKPLMKRLLLLSKFPLIEEAPFKFTADPAILLVKIKINDSWVHLLMMHSTRPSSGSNYYKNQVEQFDKIAELVKEVKCEPFIMIGDLNTTPWGYSFKRLLRKTGLKNSMDGFGWQATFPQFVNIPKRTTVIPFLPIDHVLVSKEILVLNRKTGSDLSSDHLSVIVELAL